MKLLKNYIKPLIGFLCFFCFAFNGKMLAQDKTEIIVNKDGTGDFTSIQAAINACKAFPDKRIKILVKNGRYYEKIRIPACNTKLSIIGESTENTIITFDDFFDKINKGRNSTFFTYTFLVEANDFFAENLTIENTSGAVGQAIALHIEGDRCVIRNCRITGNQDTLYAAGQNSRQYFIKCYIEGTTDYIFGAATALFDSCTIHSKADSYITAASTPKGKNFGFVFRNCKLTANEDITRVYLGRPWRDFAKVVYIKCDFGTHILPEGWANWEKTQRDKTAFYAEYECYGEGAKTEKRVNWSYILTKKEAKKYSLENILAPCIPLENKVLEWINAE